MPATIPKTWKKTSEEKNDLWKKLSYIPLYLQSAIKQQNLGHIKAHLVDMEALIKKIERAQVADALDKV